MTSSTPSPSTVAPVDPVGAEAAYWVTSVDDTTTYAGPFPTWDDANDAAETFEVDNAAAGLFTDIRYLTQ